MAIDDLHAKRFEFLFWMHGFDGDLEPYVLLLTRQELGLGAFLLEFGGVCVEGIYGAFALFNRHTRVGEL